MKEELNKTTQKKYVGQTIDTLEERWKGHLEAANSKTNQNKLSLQTAIRKYRENDFSVEIIDKGSTNIYSLASDIKNGKNKKIIFGINELEESITNGNNITCDNVTLTDILPGLKTLDTYKFLSINT